MAIRGRVAAILLVASSPLAAQQATLTGMVREAETGRPLQGAAVSLSRAGISRLTRTDAAGSFVFLRADTGTSALTVRRLGYQPVRAIVQVRDSAGPVTISMRRIATLDTVSVLAARQGIFGVVGTITHPRGEPELHPLPGARVQVLGSTVHDVTVDSSAHFFIEVETPGTQVVRARAEGFLPRTVSVTVHSDRGTEVSMLLDSAYGRSTVPLEVAYDEFRIRLLRLKSGESTLIPREELGSDPRPRLIDVIRSSRSFARKGLRFGDLACIFVDGRPRPGMGLNALDPTSVEFVEVYGEGGDESGSLALSWPGGFPCVATGNPRTAPGKEVVKWVVLWTRR